jgi:hypothetical protein
MGGFIGLASAAHPGRVSTGRCQVGETYLQDRIPLASGTRPTCRSGALTPDKDSITDPRARMFRAFADQPGKDRLALAACMRAMSPRLPREILSDLKRPVLVVDGSEDETAGRPEPLAQAVADGHAVTIPGRDHMSAVGDKNTRQAVIGFFH